MFWDSMPQSYSGGKSTSRMAHKECLSPYETDKENVQFLSPRSKLDADLSLYEMNSPSHMSCDGSPAHSSFTLRRPLDDHDHNSQDSGYSAFESKSISPKSRGLSFASMASMEEFLDMSELETEEDNVELPGDFNKLITGSLNVNEENSPDLIMNRPQLRRPLSMITNSPTNIKTPSRVRSCLFEIKEEIDVKNFKRPEPPTDLVSPVNIKRSRIHHDVQRIAARPIFQRSQSTPSEAIKSALQRSSNEPDLIGDFSRAFCLPLVQGRHQDLKSITPETLAQLMRGDFADTVASYKVIDCRYPYEFQGGHIANAENIYTKAQIQEELLTSKIKNEDEPKRNILVFHCEFSSERGPNLSRFLRNMDRNQNKDLYPYLHYPEIYLLDGGYKNFYENYSELCAPNAYLPMLHPDYEHSLRHFRTKSKTWNCDMKRSFKRL